MRRQFVNALTISSMSALLLIVAIWMYRNFQNTLEEQNLTFGYDFLLDRSGFSIGDSWITHLASHPYYHAAICGLVNTLVIAILGIFSATVIGIIVALFGASSWRYPRIFANLYVNSLRNIPLLVQILFWHAFLLHILPAIHDSHQLGWVYWNNRGLFFPSPSSMLWGIPLLIALFIPQQIPYRKQLRLILIGIAGILLITDNWHEPSMSRFTIRGGSLLSIEWQALFISLTTYTAGYIAEVIRTGLEAVQKHQYEAAKSLGLGYLQTMKYVILPQAKPIFFPALLNQYLNLTKNASLGIAIGYPDFFSVTAGTMLNQSGRTLEIMLLVMCVYSIINQVGMRLIARFNHIPWKA